MAVTRRQRRIALLTLLLFCLPLMAAILPEDRFDALYHSYRGGGLEVSGPSLLLRKQLADQFSMSGHYYVDTISSATIDVVTQASTGGYDEERTEYGVSADYLNDKNTLSLGYTTSSESDYQADTISLGLSQDFFGDLTTLSMGFSRGWDQIGKSTDSSFVRHAERRSYRLGLSQIVSKNAILSLSGDLTTDEGFLNNPYRSYYYLDGTIRTPSAEVYPGTRTSGAVAVRGLYYLPYRAALGVEYRLFSDTWGIEAQHWQLHYRHPTKNGWHYEARIRQYDQTHASFYRDLFDSEGQYKYMARDKELSTYSNLTLGLSASYEFKLQAVPWVDKAMLNLSWDHLRFDYKDFRNAEMTDEYGAGNEPFYRMSANVIQLYLSVWY